MECATRLSATTLIKRMKELISKPTLPSSTFLQKSRQSKQSISYKNHQRWCSEVCFVNFKRFLTNNHAFDNCFNLQFVVEFLRETLKKK